MKTLILATALLLAFAGCKKEEDPDRPRRMVLTWTIEGTEPVHVKIVQLESAKSFRIVRTLVDEDKAVSGSWGITGQPSKMGLSATFSYATLPPTGNRCHVVLTQDGQVTQGENNWIGRGVPSRTSGIHDQRAIGISASPDRNK